MAAEKIRMYGTSWCPDCARTRRFLDSRKIPYTWCDIEKDKDGCAYVEKVNRGNRSVPTLVLPDGSIMVEPSDGELEEKLNDIKGELR